MTAAPAAPRVDYGLDAPPVVRNLLLAAVAGLGLWGSAALGIWSGAVQLRLGANAVRVDVAPAGLSIGAACLAMAVWMIWSSKVGKVRARERLLDTRHWRGDEQVLDVGCGRGVLLLGGVLAEELEEVRARLGELEERVDFAERLLAQQREIQGLAPPKR